PPNWPLTLVRLGIASYSVKTMNNLAHFIGVPKGHHENSPAFQRRGKVRMPQVPKGRLEDLNARASEQPEPQPSLRDSRPFGVQLSVELKRWAGYSRLSLRDSKAIGKR